MGLLRLLLALSVILAHTSALHGFGFVGGPVAVEAFFIISGFYITLILNEKYISINDSYWLFISNRFMRLFPFYWVVLILTLICIITMPSFSKYAIGEFGRFGIYEQYGKNLSFTTYFYLGFTNLLIFFQETCFFLGINLKTGSLFYTSNFAAARPSVYWFELLPQAWSIGIELLFYLIAPFIVKRKWGIILIILLISLSLKAYASNHSFGNDPWSYRFFPFELGYFLLGAIAYLIYKRVLLNTNIPNYLNVIMLAILIVFTIVFTKLHFIYIYQLYILCVFTFLPFLFKFTKNFKIDRFIGELSYPIYITHILVMNILKAIGITQHLNVATILGSIALSILLIKFIGNRVERKRQSRVTGGKGISKNADALAVKL